MDSRWDEVSLLVPLLFKKHSSVCHAIRGYVKGGMILSWYKEQGAKQLVLHRENAYICMEDERRLLFLATLQQV